jgi:antitoxin StbD
MLGTNYLSATDLSRKTSSTLDMLEDGEAEKLVILKNNIPKAVLLSIEAYDAMVEEMEDLRMMALAFARMQTFDPEKAVTHEEMMNKFAQ